MGIGALWVPALAGFLFLTHFNGTKFTLLRSTGYQFLLRAAVTGVFLYVIATPIAEIGEAMIPIVSERWNQVFPTEYSGTAAISFMIGVTAPWILNWLPRYDALKAQRDAAFEDGDQIGLLFDQSLHSGQTIELSLTNSKAYVGRAVHSTFGHRDTGDVLIMPVFSGYREGETQNLVLTTNYAPALRDSVDPERFSVAIPIREILAVKIFDLHVYREYFEQE